MRVLYVEHTGLVSGAQRSLLVLLRGLPAGVEPVLACGPGPLRDAARAAGVDVLPLRGTEGSLRLHPVHTPRAVAELAAMGVAVRRHARAAGAEVVHANGVRAGLVADAARRLGGPPFVAHVRDVLPDSRGARAAHRAVAAGAAAVIAISRHAAEGFERQTGQRPEVVHNAVELDRFDPRSVDRAAARAELGIEEGTPVLLQVAQITAWKGQHVAIEVLARVRRRHPAATLLLAGETKFVGSATRLDNRAYLRSLEELARRRGVAGAVRFLGERHDVPALLAAADVALLPSEDEPFGRSVIEAMAMGRPVVATRVGGPPEIVEHGVDGFLLDPGDPGAWAELIGELLGDEARRTRVGEAARATAERRFAPEAHVRSVVAVYERVVARG